MNKEAYVKAFQEELEKISDLIGKELFNKLPDYDKKKMVEAKETIQEATKETSKLPRKIKENMIGAAFESLKDMSYSIADASLPKKEKTGPMEVALVTEKPKLKLKL